MKIILKIRVIKAVAAILDVVERKAATGVGELESKNLNFLSFKTVHEILISHGF
jgi:hypothetical protein